MSFCGAKMFRRSLGQSVGAGAEPFLLRILSFGQLLKGGLEPLQNTGGHHIDLFVFRQIQDGRGFQINQHIFGAIVLENNRLAVFSAIRVTREKF